VPAKPWIQNLQTSDYSIKKESFWWAENSTEIKFLSIHGQTLDDWTNSGPSLHL
jgi:hypothetical protein